MLSHLDKVPFEIHKASQDDVENILHLQQQAPPHLQVRSILKRNN